MRNTSTTTTPISSCDLSGKKFQNLEIETRDSLQRTETNYRLLGEQWEVMKIPHILKQCLVSLSLVFPWYMLIDLFHRCWLNLIIQSSIHFWFMLLFPPLAVKKRKTLCTCMPKRSLFCSPTHFLKTNVCVLCGCWCVCMCGVWCVCVRVCVCVCVRLGSLLDGWASCWL